MPDLSALTDGELLTAFRKCREERGDPEYDSLAFEIDHRGRVHSGRPILRRAPNAALESFAPC